MRIARDLIDPEADKVVRRLARHGFQAYLVGGCVRDLLLGRTPKDFDVATSATPKEIRQLFRNCRIIGRRFRLAHIFFGPKIIETSTFRANPREGEDASDGDELLIRRDNVFGTDTEDARRRDFTINGLFYDVEAEKVIDHVGGLEDLERRLVRTIGDPDIRFREDPVRMLRAIKFAARLDLEIESNTLAALIRHRGEIAKCAQPRVLEEIYRLLRGGAARRSMELLVETGVAGILAKQLALLLGQREDLDASPTASDTPHEPSEWEVDHTADHDDHDDSDDHHEGPVAFDSDDHDEDPVAFDSDDDDHQGEADHDEADLAGETGGDEIDPRRLEELQWAAVWSDEPRARSQVRRGSAAPAARTERNATAGANSQSPVDKDRHVAAAPPPADERFAGATDVGGDFDGDDYDEEEDAFAQPPAVEIEESALAQRRPQLWALLSQLDQQFYPGIELSNSLLLATLCAPFVIVDAKAADAKATPQPSHDLVLGVLHPLVQQLQVARRDAENTRQILLTQARLRPAHKRRGKPMSLVRREFFADALQLYQQMATLAGQDTTELSYWQRLHEQEGGGSSGDRDGKRRKRRRGGRRRRRPFAGEEAGGELGDDRSAAHESVDADHEPEPALSR